MKDINKIKMELLSEIADVSYELDLAGKKHYADTLETLMVKIAQTEVHIPTYITDEVYRKGYDAGYVGRAQTADLQQAVNSVMFEYEDNPNVKQEIELQINKIFEDGYTDGQSDRMGTDDSIEQDISTEEQQVFESV